MASPLLSNSSNLADDSIDVEKLKHLILSSIKTHSQNRQTVDVTVGVELEFFLLDQDMKPANLQTSQNFLKQVSLRPRWTQSTDSTHSNLDLSAISKENSSGRYTKLKYEYAPHMLEVAFSYFENINELYEEIKFVLDDLDQIAKACNYSLAMTPFLSPSETTSIQPESPKVRNLNQSREKYLISMGRNVTPEIALFPSYTAGTQVHIGGLNWWDNPSLLAHLYNFESICPLFGTNLGNSSIERSMQTLDKRVSLYNTCFPEMELNGFPALQEWTLDTWARALLNAPLGPASDHDFSGVSYFSIPNSNRPTVDVIFSSLRDLQFIRPRFLGTIEFRIEPSMDNAEKIAGLAAWRLGLALLAYQNRSEAPILEIARSNWEARRKNPQSHQDQASQALISSVQSILKMRGQDEYKYIGALI